MDTLASHPGGVSIDLRQMVLALETTIDLVGMHDHHHGKRVGYIARRVAEALGEPPEVAQEAFELGLLHDCGVSSEQTAASPQSLWDDQDAPVHAEIGYLLLEGFAPLHRFARPIRHHHTPWLELGPLALPAHDARMANLIYLADRVHILAAGHYGRDILVARAAIVARILEHRGTLFAPELVDAFVRVEATDAFWIALEDRHITRYTWDMGLTRSDQRLTVEELRTLSLIFAYVVDQRSPFTARHSLRVASLARYIAAELGLSEERRDLIEVAGLLHDIGKLRMPDAILKKPGPLTAVERAIMNQHSFETYEILRRVGGLEEVARWAAFHHEGIDGTGYPFRPAESEISIEARIVAVADVFQALAQHRPYRRGMGREQIVAITEQMAADGKLDRAVVEVVVRDAERCFGIARGLDPEYAALEIPFTHIEAATQDLPAAMASVGKLAFSG